MRITRASQPRRRRQQGIVMLAFAAGALLLGGFAGLALDVSYLQLWKHKAQTAADAAAHAAAIELKRTGSSDATSLAAQADAAANGFATVQVEQPPRSGAYLNNSRYVLARVSRPMPTYFLRLFGRETVTVAAMATSGLRPLEACVFVLNPSVQHALHVSGTPQVAMSCGAQVNSSSESALKVTGGAMITAPTFHVTGGTQVTNNATIEAPPVTGMPAEDDPLAWKPNPSFGACDHINFSVQGGGGRNSRQPIRLDAGVYCGGIAIHSQRPVILNSGLYVLAGGGLRINSQSEVEGEDVTFFNTAAPGYAHGSIVINGGAVLTLRAPRSGPQEGMLIWEDRNIHDPSPNHVAGHSTSSLEGILYMPNSDLSYAGGSATGAQYASIVVDTLKFTGHSRFGGNFAVLANGTPLLRSVLVQ